MKQRNKKSKNLQNYLLLINNYYIFATIKSKTNKTMKTLVETMEDAVATPSVATEEPTDTTESAAPKREISKMAIWARAHKGFIEILDPELRAQLSYYRKRDKKLEQTMEVAQ